jgi:hypothetical protein
MVCDRAKQREGEMEGKATRITEEQREGESETWTANEEKGKAGRGEGGGE